MKKVIELQITEAERSAILAALPLVGDLVFPNPVNAGIYAMTSETVAAKLRASNFLFSVAEIRCISLVASAGVSVCTNTISGYTKPGVSIGEWKDRLVPHYFALNKIEPILGAFLDEHFR